MSKRKTDKRPLMGPIRGVDMKNNGIGKKLAATGIAALMTATAVGGAIGAERPSPPTTPSNPTPDLPTGCSVICPTTSSGGETTTPSPKQQDLDICGVQTINVVTRPDGKIVAEITPYAQFHKTFTENRWFTPRMDSWTNEHGNTHFLTREGSAHLGIAQYAIFPPDMANQSMYRTIAHDKRMLFVTKFNGGVGHVLHNSDPRESDWTFQEFKTHCEGLAKEMKRHGIIFSDTMNVSAVSLPVHNVQAKPVMPA